MIAGMQSMRLSAYKFYTSALHFFFFFLHLIDNNGYQIKVFNERMFTLHSKHTFFISYLLPTPRPLDRLLIRLPTRRESELL